MRSDAGPPPAGVPPVELDLSPARLVLVAAALLLVSLAAYVARVRPIRRANRLFAAWVVGLGLAHASYLIVRRGDPAFLWAGIVTSGLFVSAAVAHAALVLTVPVPLRRDQWRVAGIPTLVVGAWVAAVIGALVRVMVAEAPLTSEDVADFLRAGAHVVYMGVAWFAVYLLAMRDALAAHDESARRRYALLGGVFAIFPAFVGGGIAFTPTPWNRFAGVTMLALALGAAAAWLRAGARGDRGRAQRNTALSILGVYLLGMLYQTLQDDWFVVSMGWAAAATAEALLLAYAVLREQVLGFDVAVKVTLRRSTMAAAFVAVFFAVSEAAAYVLGEATGSVYLGIAGTALLVFFIAPLERLAGRVVDRAMPNVKETPAYLERRKREIYRAAIESAIRDGVVTEAERDVLATLADELGLSAGEARALERDVAGVGPPAAAAVAEPP